MTETAPAVRYTIPAGRATPIVWQSAANAECILGPDPGAKDGLRLYADEDGVVRFFVRPVASGDKPVKLVMRCKVRDQEMLHPFEFRVSDKPSNDFPAPPRPVSWKPKGAFVRPALTPEEALHLSDEELRKRGLSIRPDPETAPEAFLAWRRVALTPMTFVKPRSVPRPDIVRVRPKKLKNLDAPTQESTFNWSGFELRSGGGQPKPYDYVMGQWNVPALVGSERGNSSSLMWIGLDGDSTSDLVQAGTGQFDTVMSGMHVFSYFVWTEFLPQQQTLQQVTNFVVHPNDEMFVQVSSAFAGQSEAEFVLDNVTANAVTVVITPKGSTIVGGTEAEWIVERPQFGTAFGDLADYGSAVMSSAYARIANTRRGYVAYQGNTNVQITMLDINNTNILSTVAPIDGASMRFTWQNFT
jgi:hypothetical protein